MDINTASSEKDGEKVVAPRRWKVDPKHSGGDGLYKDTYCLDLFENDVETMVFCWVNKDKTIRSGTCGDKLPTWEEIAPIILLYEIKKI